MPGCIFINAAQGFITREEAPTTNELINFVGGSLAIAYQCGNGDIFFVNSEAIIQPNPPTYGFQVCGEKFFGNGVLVSHDKFGVVCRPQTGLRTVSKTVNFLDLNTLSLSDMYGSTD